MPLNTDELYFVNLVIFAEKRLFYLAESKQKF